MIRGIINGLTRLSLVASQPEEEPSEAQGAAAEGAAAEAAEESGSEEGVEGEDEAAARDLSVALRDFSQLLGGRGVERVERAWEAGLRARTKLRGDANFFAKTPQLQGFQNRYYAILRCSTSALPTLTVSYGTYVDLVRGPQGMSFHPDSVSHAWPTEEEATVYLWASGEADFVVRD
jgi:hypothetical protein